MAGAEQASRVWRSHQLAVDEIGDPLVEIAQDPLFLRLRQPAGRDDVVELLLGVILEGRDQTVDRLVLVLRNLRQRLAALELCLDLRFGQPEVRRSGVEAGEVAEVTEVAEESSGPAKAPEEGELV